ncbi:MAG: putative toxin-antitoxin system toxin component, PIN family, partial [Methylococcaceae bacterium]|nr:putative toxin-antitoxin system toxin component, PIN family [Methylococcaceae bacterium]
MKKLVFSLQTTKMFTAYYLAIYNFLRNISNEYEDVLYRPEIQAMAKYTTEEINQILDGFLNISSWVKVNYLWRPNLKDEGDNHLIDLAVASNAEWIVTQNLKDLNSGELKFNFRAISPNDFMERV